MPTLYVTGVNDEGRSCVIEHKALDPSEGWFEALRLAEPVAAVRASSPEVALLAPPTGPGGLAVNIFPWAPGQRTGMHRTVTTDLDVVLEGSLVMHLEDGSVELSTGDVAIITGVAHAWESGPNGAIAMYCLIAGEATGYDIGRETLPLL